MERKNTRPHRKPGAPRRTRRTRSRVVRALLPVAIVLVIGRGAHADKADFYVVVHPKNPVASAERAFLSDAFLKKTTRWRDGETIRPVDLARNSAVRQRFSESVLKRSVAAVRSYWQQRIFSGRGLPPPELDSDEAVVSYVLMHRGAIGYVSANANLGNAKVVAIH